MFVCGLEASYGGVAEDAGAALAQEEIDRADLIVVVRRYIREILKSKFCENHRSALYAPH